MGLNPYILQSIFQHLQKALGRDGEILVLSVNDAHLVLPARFKVFNP